MSNNTIKEVLKIFENGWNKQVILYGPPGTSKTYSATIIAAVLLAKKTKDSVGSDEKLLAEKTKDSVGSDEKKAATELLKAWKKQPDEQNSGDTENLYKLAGSYLKERKDNYRLGQFHPSYSYEDFVRGITGKPSENGNGVTYEVEPKVFEKFCRKKGPKVLVIDEINRAPLASVLGELIYGLEYRGEEITTPYELKNENGEDTPLTIPADLYIIGTMNTADRTIGTIDYAVRRRFAFVKVDSRSDAIKASWVDDGDEGKNAANLYNKLMDKEKGIFAKEFLEDPELDVEDIKIGHTYFLGRKDSQKEKGYLDYRVKYQIIPIYKEYIKDGLISRNGEEKFKEIIKKVLGEDRANEIIKDVWGEA